MKHIIINVGRQVGAGGQEIGRMLAQDFEAKFYDRELLNLAAKESGFSEKFFKQNDEKKGFLRGLFNVQTPHLSGGNLYGSNFSQESLFQFQSDAIRKAAQEGSCVFLGRCADYVLRDFDNVVNVFITASMDFRVQLVSKVKELDGRSTTTITPARNGGLQRAMICVSTPVYWDWKKQRNSLPSLSERSSDYEADWYSQRHPRILGR